jgi:hypothetical protein
VATHGKPDPIEQEGNVATYGKPVRTGRKERGNSGKPTARMGRNGATRENPFDLSGKEMWQHMENPFTE